MFRKEYCPTMAGANDHPKSNPPELLKPTEQSWYTSRPGSLDQLDQVIAHTASKHSFRDRAGVLSLYLTSKRGRARRCVLSGLRVVEVDQDTRVVGTVRARDRHLLGVGSPTASGDSNLGTGDVKLRTADAARAVKGDVLGAEQVIAVLHARGDGDVDSLQACVISSTSVT